MTRRNQTLIALGLVAASIVPGIVGCGGGEGEASAAKSGTETPGGIAPQKFADAVHAVMMADRTVYAKHVVTRLKEQKAPVSPSEYWQDEDHTIPLPAQMFRMGSELVSENAEAGFTYALKSKYPLNSQNKASGLEVEALDYIEANPEENFYKEEEIAGKKYFTAVYADKAVAKACWECHNDHANKGDDYPVFEEGDVMGGVVVRIPLD